jgi:hypothetical protein
MAYTSKIFTTQIDSEVIPLSFSSPYDDMVIKDLDITIIKSGSNDVVGRGYVDLNSQVAEYSANNGTTRKSGYSLTKAVYIQEFNGTTWADKVVGTADISTTGEIWFTFTLYDANYYMIGVARGDIA